MYREKVSNQAFSTHKAGDNTTFITKVGNVHSAACYIAVAAYLPFQKLVRRFPYAHH